MRWLAIVGMCIAAAVLYGIVHDQVTARICIEYFTIGHPHIGTESPTLVALFWGVVATWWVGLGLGIPLACFARWGKPPRIEPRELLRPLLLVLGISAVVATIAGVLGWIAATNEVVWLQGSLRDRVPREAHTRFLIALWIHSASYVAGAIGGLFLCGWTLGLRKGRRGSGGAVASEVAPP